MSDSLHWFRVPNFTTPAEALAAVQPLGVELAKPMQFEACYYWSAEARCVMVQAGVHRVYDNGRILVRPSRCLPTEYLITLIGGAEDAFRRSADPSRGWRRVRRSKKVPVAYRYSWVSMPADDTEIGRIILAARVRDELEPDTDLTLSVSEVEAAPEGNPTWSVI